MENGGVEDGDSATSAELPVASVPSELFVTSERLQAALIIKSEKVSKKSQAVRVRVTSKFRCDVESFLMMISARLSTR